MEPYKIKIDTVDQEIYSHISSCVGFYNKTYINPRLDVLFRLYIYAYEETNRDERYSCVPNRFLGVTSNGDAWSDILLSTSLADVFGIEKKDHKLNVSDALDNRYACLVLIGKYILCKPKVQKKVIPYFWHMLDKLLYDYETDEKSKISPLDKKVIAYYLDLDFHDKQNRFLKCAVPRIKLSTKGFMTVKEESRKKTEKRIAAKKEKIVDAVKKISSDFDNQANLDRLTKDENEEKTVKDTDGKDKNYIRFQPYIAPLVRASYVSAYRFPYLPQKSVYTAYKKYEDIYGTKVGIDKKAYVCLKRIIRYKDYAKNVKKNIKIRDDLFIKKYFCVLRATFESLRRSEPSGASVYYKCDKCTYRGNCKFMEDEAYYYLTEKIYGYYLFWHEAQLIKEQENDFDSLSHEKKRLLKRALKYIFLHCPGVFVRLRAADEAIKFIFEDSFEPIIPDFFCPETDEELEEDALMRYAIEQNSSKLKEILDGFYE